MAITQDTVNRMSRAALAQLSPVMLALSWNGRRYLGAKADDRTERKFRPAGFDPGHRLTWVGCAADFSDGLPTARPVVEINGEKLRAVACETDAAGGLVRVELSDLTAD